MTPKELETQILALPLADKAKVMELLTQTLSNGSRGILKTSGVVGGDACIAGTRIPVWSLVLDRRLGATDARILEMFPHLTAADLVNAWAYADAYPEEIETAIQDNETAMQDNGAE